MIFGFDRFILSVFFFLNCGVSVADLRVLNAEWSQPFLSIRLQNMQELSISEEGAPELLFLGRDGLKKRYSAVTEQSFYSFRGKKTQGSLVFCGAELCRFRESFYFGDFQAVQNFSRKFAFWRQILEDSGFVVSVLRRKKNRERFEVVLCFKKDCGSYLLEGSIAVVEFSGNFFRGVIEFRKKDE
jgi:hypothetical protein